MAKHRISNHPVHQHLLAYKNARWGWISGMLTIACVVLYFTQADSTPPNGGTWQGFALGTVGALLIVWLAWLGFRKRSYHAKGSLQGWTSAHVYLGAATLVIGTLHCAFQFGNNVHTLAYLLMVGVILSGFYGLYAYLRLPDVLGGQRAGKSRVDLMEELSDLDAQAIALARKIGAEELSVTESAIKRSTLGGNRRQQLFAGDASRVLLRTGEGKGSGSRLVANPDQDTVIDFLARRMAKSPGGEDAAKLQQLIRLFAARRGLLRRLRRDIQVQALLRVWLVIHVPLTLALLVALSAHILSVFYFW